jgi:DNA-binding transcriptional regulator WhiA
MKNIMVFKLFTLVLVSFLFNFNAIAENGEQSKKFGDYTVYYNTFNSSVLAANIAKQYGITRGNSTGVINIAVHKGNDDESAAVDAFLSGSIKNLLSQNSQLSFKKVKEGDAVYYLATFQFNNRDKLTFDINITPKSEKLGFNFKFQNQFYTD